MKTFIPLTTVLLSAIVLVLTSCNFNCVDKKGPIITDTRMLEDFNSIHLSIPAKVEVVIGSESGITITAPESYVNEISTNISRRNLKIEGNICRADIHDVEIVIYITEVTNIELSGSAEIFSNNPVKSDKLDLEVNGSGEITLNVFSNDIKCKINGSGTINLDGSCQYLDVKINGSGDFKASELKSYKTKIKINGSGRASILTHDKLNASVNGSGVINYAGDPKISINIAGSGKVNKIN